MAILSSNHTHMPTCVLSKPHARPSLHTRLRRPDAPIPPQHQPWPILGHLPRSCEPTARWCSPGVSDFYIASAATGYPRANRFQATSNIKAHVGCSQGRPEYRGVAAVIGILSSSAADHFAAQQGLPMPYSILTSSTPAGPIQPYQSGASELPEPE